MDVHGPLGLMDCLLNSSAIGLLFTVAMVGPGMLIIVKPGYICILG